MAPNRRTRTAWLVLLALVALAIPVAIALAISRGDSPSPDRDTGGSAAPLDTSGTAAGTPLFAEEFDGGELGDAWAVETPWHTQYTSEELQWYEEDNLEIADGLLRITTKEEQVTPGQPAGSRYRYTSAMITTGSREDYGGTSRKAFTYGYFEMRAKLPKGQGMFPAFWLTNDRESEIDIMEMLGHEPDKVYLTLHYRQKGVDRAQRETYRGPDFSAGFHTFAVDWQPGYVRYYVDGVQHAEFTSDVPTQPMWIVANTAVGGPWAGAPDGTTEFPQRYDIDYIRVWRTKPGTKD